MIKHYQKPWKILSAVCLVRLNSLSRPLTELETRYAQMQDELELENSVNNDYELKLMRLVEKDSSKKQKMTDAEEQEMLVASRELATMREQEDIWADNLKNMKLASRETDADRSQDDSSIHRKLDQTLHYVVKDQELLNGESFLYPYTELLANENLRQASERLLGVHGFNSDLQFLSNAPVGVMKVKFNKDEQRGIDYQGAKIFFMRASLMKPPIDSSASSSSMPYKWLTLDEMASNINEEYFKRIRRFMS